MELENDPTLSAYVAERAAEHKVPGISVGVIHGGRAFVATQGVTSVSDPLEVTADTLFMIGSTTKTLTASALMALVDQGALTLKDRVIDHLPDFAVLDPFATANVTVGQLLNHTAGWRGDAVPSTGYGDDALARALELVAAGPQEFAPGEHFSYNNAALMVAGRVLEVVTGKTYEQAVTDLVLTPLGMTNTWFQPWETAQRRAAVGHLLRETGPETISIWPVSRGMAPAGAASSSLRDQLTYAAYHLDGTTTGTAPLTEATRQLMQEPTAETRSILTGVGISWLLSQHGDARLVAHGGNISNLQTSAFTLAPDLGLAVVVMGNSRGGAAVGKDVIEWALTHFADVPDRTPMDVIPYTATLLEEYVGTYDLGSWLLGVTEEDGRLFTQMIMPEGVPDDVRLLFANPPTELVLVGADQVAPADAPFAPTGDFVRDASGAVTWFRHGMRMAPRKETS